MPIFLEQPSYGPAGPDGQGWNRLSLNAHFDTRHQCGWQPTNFPTLFESMTGRQGWGSYERCHKLAPGGCKQCPVQRRVLEKEGGLAWPEDTPLLLARVRPWPHTPGAMFADPAAGRSDVELQAWPLGQAAITTTWLAVRNTSGLRLSWFWRDDDGEAFWIVRNNPSAEAAVVRTRQVGTHTRHALYGRRDGPRTAVLTCHGGCAHDALDLQHLAADLAHRGTEARAPAAAQTPDLPGLRSVRLTQEDGHSVLRRHDAVTRFAWDMVFDEFTATALVAHAVRVTSAT